MVCKTCKTCNVACKVPLVLGLLLVLILLQLSAHPALFMLKLWHSRHPFAQPLANALYESYVRLYDYYAYKKLQPQRLKEDATSDWLEDNAELAND
jgi:hypothetical protein